jgi:hypothetical protein
LFLALGMLMAAGGGTAHAQSAAEVAFWNRIRDSTNASELRAYLEAYPNGAFAETARASSSWVPSRCSRRCPPRRGVR